MPVAKADAALPTAKAPGKFRIYFNPGVAPASSLVTAIASIRRLSLDFLYHWHYMLAREILQQPITLPTEAR